MFSLYNFDPDKENESDDWYDDPNSYDEGNFSVLNEQLTFTFKLYFFHKNIVEMNWKS